jgi:hypothetical protein
MEKVIYALWRDSDTGQQTFFDQLLTECRQALAAAPGVRGIRVNLPDREVERAASLRMAATRPQMDAVVQLWLDVSHGEFRAPVDAVLARCAPRMAAWLVTESEVIRNQLHPPREGARTEGWSQFCFLQRSSRLTHAQWLSVWQGLHTRVAIDTQSNFEYIQNPVVRQLLGEPMPYVSMVEECFPTDAMDHTELFFDAVGDEAKFKRNTAAMAESCARFIDFDGIDVIPTSQYVIRSRR